MGINNMIRKPCMGQVWKHTNGNKYKVINIANDNTERPEQYPVTVVYKNISNGTIWSRKLEDWHRSMEYVETPGQIPLESLEEVAESLGIPTRQPTEEGEAAIAIIVCRVDGIEVNYGVSAETHEADTEETHH